MKFTLSINELDSPLEIEILARLAEIVIEEGQIVIEPDSILWFIQYIVSGLSNHENGYPLIVGKIVEKRQLENWICVANNFDRAAELIRANAIIK